MGDGRDTQRSAAGGVASEIVTGTFSPDSILGKRTLTGDPNSPTGNEYIDHHPLCTRTVSTDCFLDRESRTAMIEDYKRHVSDAHNAYERALLSIRIDQLVKKDDDLPWFITLVLEVASAEIVRTLTRTLTAVKADQLTKLTAAGKLGADAAREATAGASAAYVSLSLVSDGQLTAMCKGAFDVGKKSALVGLKSEFDREEHDDRSATLSYLDKLSAVAELAFEELAAKPPGEATDAQLLVLWKAFQPPAHGQEVYKVLLEDKIARYMKSGIRDIGRSPETVTVCNDSDCIAKETESVMRDTVVVRVKFKSGYADRFAYAKKEWGYRVSNTLPQERMPETELPMDQDRFHGSQIPVDARLQMQPSFDRFIEPEFADAAIERHLQVWGKPPETIETDDSSWVWDKDRAQKAKENKAKEPGPFGIPRLQLPSQPDAIVEIPDELRLKGSQP